MRVCTHMQYNRARGEKKSKTRMEGGGDSIGCKSRECPAGFEKQSNADRVSQATGMLRHHLTVHICLRKGDVEFRRRLSGNLEEPRFQVSSLYEFVLLHAGLNAGRITKKREDSFRESLFSTKKRKAKSAFNCYMFMYVHRPGKLTQKTCTA